MESRSVNQRPSYESDAYLDCRLTAPIMPEGDVTKWKERYDLWDEGNRESIASVFLLPSENVF